MTCQSCKCNPIFLRDLPARRIIKAKCNELIMSDQQLGTYMTNFLSSIKQGLKKETNPTSIVKCFPTYVQDLPDGSEKGQYLALDLGGSNLRVLIVTLNGSEIEMENEVFTIPEEVMTGPGEGLFDFIADSIFAFTSGRGVADANLPLGFTFSFPLIQKGIKVGILERWTKGFTCPGVVGRNVVEMLEEAVARREAEDLKINIVAVLNDTTGTLMSCAVKDNDCKIGLIVGTGTNGCYVERQYNAELFDEPDKGSGVVIINMESGAFGDDGALDFCRTQYDIDVDKHSVNPGKQQHEKMISGMYLGELVRLAVVRFAEHDNLMFNGKLSEKFRTRGTFETRFVSEIEEDAMGDYTNVKRILEELEVTHGTDDDFQDVRFICACFSRRAAHLVSALIATLIRKMDYRKCTIGIDGTLYKNHPHFHNILMHKVQEILIPDSYKFKIMLAEDGSGIGAALVAAVAARVPGGRSADEGDEGGEEEPPAEEE